MITDPQDTSTLEMNFEEHKKDVQINVSEFEAMGKELFTLREKQEALEMQLEEVEESARGLKKRIMDVLDSMGKEKHFVGGKGTLYIENRFNVSMPKEPTAKKEFFDHLRAKGIFEAIVTVNHQTLNAYYKEELAAAVEAGNADFKLPGIGEPLLIKTLKVRRG